MIDHLLQRLYAVGAPVPTNFLRLSASVITVDYQSRSHYRLKENAIAALARIACA